MNFNSLILIHWYHILFNPGFYIRYAFFSIILITDFLAAQAQDSLYTKDKTYNYTVYFEGTNTVKIAGNYLPGSLIRHGEWIYFYPNGQPRIRMLFIKDLKRGTWIYYDEKGKVLRKERMHEKGDHPMLAPGGLDDVWRFIGYWLKDLKL